MLNASTTEALVDRIRGAGLHLPETLTLMVTRGCNLHCRHCWLDCRPLDDDVPIEADRLKSVIYGFAELGGKRITLTGGEVFSHPDWPRLLSFSLRHGRLEGVCVQTNATLITRAGVKRLLDMPCDKLTIQVSLDGACARSHDLVRGSGSYCRAMAGLGLLLEAGLGPLTQIAFTEMAHNFDEFPQLLAMADRMGIKRLVGGALVRGGRAAASSQMELPSPDQYRHLIRLYQKDPGFRRLYDRKGTLSPIEWLKNRSASTETVCSCLENLFLDARGVLYPCTMLLLERYASESVYEHGFYQAVEAALTRWEELPVLSRKRQEALTSCSRCAGKAHCGGGCMGRAATVRGDLMDPEDRCSLRKAVYSWNMQVDA